MQGEQGTGDALARLFRRQNFGVKLGLETMQRLLGELGDPHRSVACIHVAGSNGKGSVCALVESALRALGLHPGLYISPHLVRFNERIRVDGREIEDGALLALLACVEEADARAVRAGSGRQATFFEFVTAMAFEHFRRCNTRLVVLETGLGGRLDATNVVDPLVSVLTTISLEHTQYLGSTLGAIAGEKCGIVKPGRPVVTGALEPEAMSVVLDTVQRRRCSLLQAAQAVTVTRLEQTLAGQRVRVETPRRSLRLCLPFLGRHQLANLAIAFATLEVVEEELGQTWDERRLREGIEGARWPARLQVLGEDPLTLLDGSHNPEGAVVLRGALRELAAKRKIGLVLGMCDDKDADAFLRALAPVLARCWTVPLRVDRGRDPEELARSVRTHGCPVDAMSVPEALAAARAWATDTGGVVCIAGSLYLAGEVLERVDHGDCEGLRTTC